MIAGITNIQAITWNTRFILSNESSFAHIPITEVDNRKIKITKIPTKQVINLNHSIGTPMNFFSARIRLKNQTTTRITVSTKNINIMYEIMNGANNSYHL
jgi:hypothetical protein